MNPLQLFLLGRKHECVRLEKDERSRLDKFCEKIVPYVLFTSIVILLLLVVFILIRYGANLTGTEANQYYNHINNL